MKKLHVILYSVGLGIICQSSYAMQAGESFEIPKAKFSIRTTNPPVGYFWKQSDEGACILEKSVLKPKSSISVDTFLQENFESDQQKKKMSPFLSDVSTDEDLEKFIQDETIDRKELLTVSYHYGELKGKVEGYISALKEDGKSKEETLGKAFNKFKDHMNSSKIEWLVNKQY